MDLDYKNLFVKEFTEYVVETKCVNYINLSGIGLESVENKELLIDLALALSNSKALESIHLSDNQLSYDKEFYEDFLSYFGVSSERDEREYI